MANACGVDFGTSNSTVGWARPGSSPLLVLEDGKVTLPSVVFFNADEEQVYYGRAALSNYLEGYEGRLMRSLKSLLGTSLIDDQTEVMGKVLPFRTLLTQFISELKHRAEQAAGREFSSAVLGRPVHFVDGNEEADTLAEDTLYEIAQSVGFKEIDFQFEPIAAAFDYEAQLTREELVLIVDIGGGTSDFSLVRLSPERARQADRRHDILATGGVHIGGTDFDKYLSLNSIMPLLGMGSRLNSGVEVPSSYFYNLATWHTINLAYTQKTYLQIRDIYRDATEKNKLDTLLDLIENRSGHWLAIKAEEGKIALSSDVQTELHLDRLRPVQSLLLDRAVFEQAIDHLVTEIEATVAALLRDADIHVDDIDTVVFTGGSSGVRLLREKVAALLPNAKRVEGDLFGSIGAGLALDAERKFG
ncbi:MAG: Hsp70 family protein [Oxalicibacterium faecigallinarum]|uniref:Hsp70 family protein n=1 Tax=Oxalicibacterium faecigallinarum TaxID=573741 RepID=UPI0028075829|nr:Hsp70 family protein [Oxalicibacterium faecigallinarum]MDQ7969288.1 Hsp70 family protein [Oxalicibacterium faecigallinarum]